jgi:hypothetical protein
MNLTIYQWVALLSIGSAVGGAALTAFRFRGGQPFSVIGIAVQAAGPALSLWLYLQLAQIHPRPATSVVLLGIGALIGVLAAKRVDFVALPNGRQRLRAWWLPMPSVAALAALQIAAAFGTYNWFVLAFAALEVAVAFGIGAAATLVVRRGATPVPRASLQLGRPA